MKSSPFHVRFGKLKVLHSKEKLVTIFVNGVEAPFKMKLGEAGEGYFEEIFFDDQQEPRVLDIEEAYDDIEEKEEEKSQIPNRKSSDDIGKAVSEDEIKQLAQSTPIQRKKSEDITETKPKSRVGTIMSYFKGSKRGPFPDRITVEFEEAEEEAEEETVALELSLCGDALFAENADQAAVFTKFKVTEEAFFKDPQKIMADPKLMVRIGSTVYKWSLAAPIILGMNVFKKPIPESVVSSMSNTKTPVKAQRSSNGSGKKEIDDIPSPPETKEMLRRQSKTVTFRKTLRPTSKMLQSFGLKPGTNTITFTVTTSLQGTQSVSANICLWDVNTKIVISDVDGTITKSDVLGQLMPMVGKDWSHLGVTELYTNIKKNGYQMLYLTARAIGQSNQTRSFLMGLAQGMQKLPEGPLILSPDRLMSSFRREVIVRRPEVFKIAALRDILSLFPDKNPFYAGFGNRDTDAVSYRAVGISMNRIFIINPQGDIHQMNNTYKKTYNKLNELVHEMFPPIDTILGKEIAGSDEFVGPNYWSLKPTEDELKNVAYK
eukprot:TRINITY_DN1217_c0_g1_i1.p1 TRINITY_DN1217_c0_g1~~TRINITY_DN1217_c0_g1_i1.p1  ORF type:complete len:545 (+),score=137.47 TRINITY_DN1217_c0_g1_i1:195-1829(+)